MSYLEYCENEITHHRKAIKEKDARIAKLEALVAERDAWLGKKTCAHSRCSELNAARALLREVLEGEKKSILHYEVEKHVREYFDACDKPGATT